MPQSMNSTMRFNGTSDVVSYSTTSTQSAAVSDGIQDIRVLCTTDAWVNIGDNPTASAADGSFLMTGGVAEYFHVSPGQKVAVIRDAADGTLIVAEMSR